jgi:rubrerythrin
MELGGSHESYDNVLEALVTVRETPQSSQGGSIEREAMDSPTCAGVDKHHHDRLMQLIGLEDDGTLIWRCPRCLYVWRERP